MNVTTRRVPPTRWTQLRKKHRLASRKKRPQTQPTMADPRPRSRPHPPRPAPIPTPMTFTERFFHGNTKAPLIVEVVLSLFTGIFGVGWLLIGKKRTGTILLAMSLIFYLPLLILSYGLAYFSYGLSILCTGPFTIAAVLLNAFMLYKTMQRVRASSAQFNVPNEF